MSVLGIGSTALLGYLTQNLQGNRQQVSKEFQQLGQDLQSGNLSAAESELATLQKEMPQISSGTASQGSPITQAFGQLSQDLQSGNIAGAQQDYSKIQQDVQNMDALRQSLGGHHHHRAYSSLQQDLMQSLQSGGVAGGGTVSVRA